LQPAPARGREHGERRQGAHEQRQPAGTGMFATAIPGLAPLVGKEVAGVPGLTVSDSGFDGRSDVVLFGAGRGRGDAALGLRTTEDVFVEVGRARRADGDDPRRIAGRLWRPEQVQRALSVWSAAVRPLASSMTYRVIARVLSERSFLRTDLRRELGRAIGADKPRWRAADPAQIEVWVGEYEPGMLVAGLRLTDARMRQHGGRDTERRGALRPTVAVAMVGLAGEPRGVLLDPCCGTGTILAEALESGWSAAGVDLDPAAVETARRNVPSASIEQADARALDLADGSVGACVANLPFGQQYEVQGDMTAWLRAVLGELARVTRPGGRVVLLAPRLPRAAVPAGLQSSDRYPIRLLGTRTTIWALDRS
jgi:23S rRNA G2445 N2-methylase RlmL